MRKMGLDIIPKWKGILLGVDKKISRQLRKIQKDSFAKELICEFDRNVLPVHIGGNNNALVDIPDGHGIYLFEAKFRKEKVQRETFVEYFNSLWNKDRASIIHYPAIIKSRIALVQKNFNKKQWVPIYLGKTEHLNRRINAHINLGPDKKTFALKLAARKKTLCYVSFRVKYIKIRNTQETQILLSKIETVLRRKIGPILGRQ